MALPAPDRPVLTEKALNPLPRLFSRYVPQCAEGMPHSWAKYQNPAKIRFEKFVKLTGHTYSCNNFTNL